MELDPNSLERIKAFAEFIEHAKQLGVTPSFVSTPTEHGDNITAMATINGERRNIGILFWDVNLLQDRGLVDVLDEDDKALGLTITDGILEDTAQLLAFAEAELDKLNAS